MGKKSRQKLGPRRRIWGAEKARRMALEATRGLPEGLRRAILEGGDILDDARFWQILVGSGEYQRAAVMMGWRDSVAALRDGRKCDLCASRATKVALVVGEPGDDLRGVELPGRDDAAVMFAVLCKLCHRLPESARDPMLLERFARAMRDHGGEPLRYPTVVGRAVGDAPSLPARASLMDCHECGASTWVDQDDRDRVSADAPGHEVVAVCTKCAPKMVAEGRLEAAFVPTFSWDSPACR